MSLTKVYSFATNDKVSQALGEFIAHASSEAIARSGRFTIAFSGGSLPATACKYLRDNQSIDFSKWYVFFADERCVKLDSHDSNFRLVREELLDHLVQQSRSIPADQVMVINDDLIQEPPKVADDYLVKMQSVFAESNKIKFPEFDLILLGIGPDGHTCSLFPNHQLLEVKNEWVASIEDSPKEPPQRITLTLPVVNHARKVAFVVTGAGKKSTVKAILDEKNAHMPASLVAPIKGDSFWFLDDAAAKGLTENTPTDFKL
ncbi:suppressor of los1-1 [Coemansia sp. RSA 989]|nr:6-phosphogluconolactonase [Coemansia mojavensis]KAJ1740559.1 suppressor of los1-1 [Coemansia sp. RSA 1086]KAJ1749152.1 suppressor of los1-1 [Coemansia sp. RSA 1821]KAJ1862922.1 suppressor of los1-1 [Coemansia sp. RSA 989]KAJ1870866.1 suppressor of los1-1 [Coemansia sp. RSA 990]KAJ2630097.1 suppressor of los1-1 [Coemansia sp. RSA 1290]KAJ2646831.1 suppressor of los1-1 [Coemansia sp. RSA 1250]KAJ2668545.1 suppressor of los1-1 [Coemansia sp. RSA 1085]